MYLSSSCVKAVYAITPSSAAGESRMQRGDARQPLATWSISVSSKSSAFFLVAQSWSLYNSVLTGFIIMTHNSFYFLKFFGNYITEMTGLVSGIGIRTERR